MMQNKDKKPDLVKTYLGIEINNKWVLVTAVMLVTFICFSYSLQNQFTGWDDDTYVTYNKYITSLSGDNLHALLFKNVTQNYYHPITMLSLAVNHQFSQLRPFGYYLTNILIHLFNVFLVFMLSLKLAEAMATKGYQSIKNKNLFAVLCALWWGVHPMHVESVSWISERKDLLYSLFYFVGIYCHVRYIENKERKWLLWVFVFYVLSCLSKPMAVVFPVSLLAVDVLLKRKIELKLFTEKLPLFLFSIAAGVLAFHTSDKAASVASLSTITFGEHFMFPAYGLMMYNLKAIFPFFLSSFYPYPDITAPTLPIIFYLAPVIAISMVCLPLYLSYKKDKSNFTLVVFGIGFYLANLVFVLQFISVGRTIMSDRYSYMAYFGLLFTILYFIFTLMNKRTDLRTPLEVVLASVSIIFAIMCNARTHVWHNSETLWRNVAENYPSKVAEAYESLGNYYYLNGNIDSAYSNFKTLSTIYYKDPYVFNKVGNLCMMREDYDGALEAFTQSLKVDSTYYFSYIDRGNLYAKVGKFDLALPDYSHAYRLHPNDEKLLLSKGAAELNTGAIEPAITDFTKVLSIDPTNATAAYVLSLAYKKGKDYTNAVNYAQKAASMGYSIPKDYISGLQQASDSAAKTSIHHP